MQFADVMKNMLPSDWYPMDVYGCGYDTYEVNTFIDEYQQVANKALTGTYYNFIFGIYKVQNPLLYAKFLLKKREYEQRGPYEVLQLFHDTYSCNIDSIARYNLDWRRTMRMRFGPGVYFSVLPDLAHKYALKGCFDRAMFICDVLVQSVQKTQADIFLPDYGYDTVLANKDTTYVKYFDSEFYPRYFIHYYARW